MALLSTADQDRLRAAFAAMTRTVKIVFFTQTLGCETCPETRQIIDELPALSDKIAIEDVSHLASVARPRRGWSSDLLSRPGMKDQEDPSRAEQEGAST